MNRTFKSFFIKAVCAFLLAGGVLIWGPNPFCAERQIGPTKTAEVMVEKKLSRSLLTKELHAVRISRYTEYVDQSGRKIPYDLLRVPCKAVIVYEPESRGNPVAVSVTVKQSLPGASTAIVVVPE